LAAYLFDLDNRIYLMILMILLVYVLYLGSKKSSGFRKLFIITAISLNLIYMIWRTLYTLPLSFGIVSVILGIALLLAEWVGFWQSIILKLLFWKPFQNRHLSIEGFAVKPTVAIFIATYNENIEILRKTIAGCQNISYPRELLGIYLCDDGRRQEARLLCEEMGISYISREDNLHAKAGNLNNALSRTDSEFVMLLDADMVPKSGFLNKTLGYFTDLNVGFVQTPQVFYNPDPFQFNLKFGDSIPNEQDFFMLEIQGGRANYNAVLHVGTNAVFRRSAIDEIGGIPTGTITEDMATGMLIQAKGYRSIFVKEVLCTGLSVESFHDLVRQRERWCRGNIQVTKKWNPLKMKGLSPMQKLIYVDGLIYWFFGVQKMIYILCPVVYLITGTVILNMDPLDLALFWTPSFAASALSFRALVSENRTITWSHIYEVAMAPYLALSALMEVLFSRPIPFKVTPKGLNAKKTTISLRTAIPHIIMLILTVLGLALTIPKLFYNPPAIVDGDMINILWAVYNGFAITMGILVCIERPRKRATDRLVVDEPITIDAEEGAICKIVDISETGIKVECDDLSDLSAENIHTSVFVSSENLQDLTGDVVWSKKIGRKSSYGIKLKVGSGDHYRKLVNYIYDKNTGYHQNKR